MNTKKVNTYLENAVFNFIVTTKDIPDISTFIKEYKEVTDKIDYSYLEKEGFQYSPKKDINQPYVSRMFEKFHIVKDKNTKVYTVDSESSVLSIQKTLIDELSKIPIACHDIIELPDSKGTDNCGLYVLTLDVPVGAENHIANILYKTLSSDNSDNVAKRITAFNAIIPGFRSVTITCCYNDNIQFIYNAIKRAEKYKIFEDCYYFDFCYNEEDIADFEKPDIQFSMDAALGDKDAQEYLDNHHDFDDNQDEISDSNKFINKESTIDYDNLSDEEFEQFLDDCGKY